MNMKKLKSLLLLITFFTLLIASEIFAAPNNEGQEAFIVTKEDINPMHRGLYYRLLIQ